MLLISLSLEGSDAIPVSHGNLQSRPRSPSEEWAWEPGTDGSQLLQGKSWVNPRPGEVPVPV